MSKSQEDFDSALVEIEKTCKTANNGKDWDVEKVGKLLNSMVESDRITDSEKTKVLNYIRFTKGAHKEKLWEKMIWRRYRYLEKRFIGNNNADYDESENNEHRTYVVRKARAVADAVIETGALEREELEGALIACLEAIPISDFRTLDSAVYKGRFFDELREKRKNDEAINKALVIMHEFEIKMLGEGMRWEEYWEKKSAEVQKVKDERKAKRKKRNAERKATFLRLWFFCGWQALISVGLIVAILFNEHLEYGYFNILRFAVCAAFAYWAWMTHNLNKQAWRNAFVLTALFYNPFLPVKLGDAGSWLFVNLLTLGLVVASFRATGSKLNNDEGDAQHTDETRKEVNLRGELKDSEQPPSVSPPQQ